MSRSATQQVALLFMKPDALLPSSQELAQSKALCNILRLAAFFFTTTTCWITFQAPVWRITSPGVNMTSYDIFTATVRNCTPFFPSNKTEDAPCPGVRALSPQSRYFLASSKKVKRSGYRPGVAQRVGRGVPLLFHDRGTRRG